MYEYSFCILLNRSIQKETLAFFDDDDLEYNGVPYIVLSQKMYDCHRGKDRNFFLDRN